MLRCVSVAAERMANVGQTGIAAVNGTHLFYEIAGTGHPLALIHSGVADSRTWDDQFDVFARDYRVLRYVVPSGRTQVAQPSCSRDSA